MGTMGQAATNEQRVIRSGKSRKPAEVLAALDRLRQDCNVHVPPGLEGIRLPDGFSVVWTEVDIDTRQANQGGEVYNVSGGYTLATTAIERLTSAFGITWDTARSGRLDAGDHPYYCSYLAVGSYMGPDGMPVPVSGTNKTDLRDSMPGAEKFRNDKGEMNTKMLMQQRQHILSISESKARSRAYRKAVGMRAMPQKEIARPWVVFRIQITGETDDPRTQRIFESMIFQNALAARAALYGPPAMPPGQMARPQIVQAPIAIAQLPEHDADGVVADDYDNEPAPESAPRPQVQSTSQRQPPKRDSQPRGSAVWPWEPKRDGDPEKGTPLTEVPDGSLERLAKYCDKKAAEGGRFADRDAALAKEAWGILADRQDSGSIDDDPDDRGDDPDKY